MRETAMAPMSQISQPSGQVGNDDIFDKSWWRAFRVFRHQPGPAGSPDARVQALTKVGWAAELRCISGKLCHPQVPDD
jgi:hypothetical protein